MNVTKAEPAVADSWIQSLSAPSGGKWIAKARQNALGRLQEMGLPKRRDEYWKFTKSDDFNSQDAQKADLLVTDEEPMFCDVDRLRLVFVDGVLSTDLSDAAALDHVEIETLAGAVGSDLHWARDVYGHLEKQAQSPVKRPLAALNTAMAEQGVLIRATGKAPRPICLHYMRQNTGSDAMVHNVVKVAPGAELTLLENGPSADRVNNVMEVDIAEGGKFHHIRAQGRDHERRAITHIFARLAEESDFKSFTLTVNGALTRNECFIEILGQNAHATIAGACVGDGQFHQDDTVFISHDAENCESRQVFKKILRNGATGVFQGKILVKPDAQKTDGYQISQGLMLDDDSRFLAKPELEIYADDVACSHGSTVGAIDEAALFYLMSRGVPRRMAQDMLVLAFLAEALDEIESVNIRNHILDRLNGWVERHST